MSFVHSPPNGRELDTMEKANRLPSRESGARRSLRIAIVTENFLPKYVSTPCRAVCSLHVSTRSIISHFSRLGRVDGVTRTLARLLEHLELEGHQALVLGPESGMVQAFIPLVDSKEDRS